MSCLLERLRQGEVDAWQILYSQIGPGIYRFLVCRLGDHSAAEDIMQEAFSRLCANLSSIREEGALKSWLYTTSRRLAIDWLRKKREFPMNTVGGTSSLGAGKAASTSIDLDPLHNPEDALERSEAAGIIRKALWSLSEEQREVVSLRIWGGLSYAEISQVTGIPESTLRSQFFWATKKLRKELEPKMQCLEG